MTRLPVITGTTPTPRRSHLLGSDRRTLCGMPVPLRRLAPKNLQRCALCALLDGGTEDR